MPKFQNASELSAVRQEMSRALQKGIIPFWLERSIDTEYGGYLLSFDGKGDFTGDDEKYIVTQSRMLWGFSHLIPYALEEQRPQMAQAAQSGFDFLRTNFWDSEYGGFVWKTARNGQVLDRAKLTYGESFAVYALSEYALRFQDPAAMRMAEEAFNLLESRAADNAFGGYYENLEADWSFSPGGAGGGDRKSLDIHMHLLEASTTLAEASGDPIHLRRLREVMSLILCRMVNHEAGFGYNQFDLQFNRIPAICINRTWNADRETNECIEKALDTTSYGHNVELSWLMDRALRLTGGEKPPILRRLLDHALRYGCDTVYGGIYRDGVAEEPALVHDKEWWQNFESMVGFLNGYCRFGEEAYLAAFQQTWGFIKSCFLHPLLGESRQLLDREGNPIVDQLGNPWKGIYHTGRALSECIDRLDLLCEKQPR